jgi:hypothetical protein
MNGHAVISTNIVFSGLSQRTMRGHKNHVIARRNDEAIAYYTGWLCFRAIATLRSQ